WEKRQLRSGACLRANVPTTLKLAGENSIDGDTILISRTSMTVKVDAPIELARGMSISLLLGDRRSYCEVPALVTHSAGRRQHLFFPDLTDEQEKQIERLAYSRRKSRRTLRDLQLNDRPLLSLAQIFLLAIRAVAIVPLGFFVPAPRADVDPIPSGRKTWAASVI